MVNPPSPKDMEKFRQEEERKKLLNKAEYPAPGSKTVSASTAARMEELKKKGGVPGAPVPKKKMALAARLKARLSARRTPAQSRFTMPAGTPAGLQQQMKDFKDGKTSQLPTPPKTPTPPLQYKGVVGNGSKAETVAKKVMQSKVVNPGARGKGGSSGAAGSWLQWSGAKRGNN